MPVIKIRRGTTQQWTTSNRVLQLGELGLDTTLNKLKAGNGTTAWASLPFLQADVDITELAQDAVATALSNGTHSNITVTYSDNDNSISLATGPDVITQTSLSNTLTDTTTGYVPIADVGNADGVASLDSDGFIPDSEIPATIARDSEIPSLAGYATETYVGTAISNLVDSSPATLNTLNELAAALGDDPNYATTISTSLGNKEPLLPSQSGNSGKFLTTDGTEKSWAIVQQHALPSQATNSGKYLTTDGTAESWATIPSTPEATHNTLGTVYSRVAPQSSLGFGNSVLQQSTGYGNAGFGSGAMWGNTSGYRNTGIGAFALTQNATGFGNTGIGDSALQSVTTSYSSALGSGALRFTTTGQANSAFGYNAMNNNVGGSSNSAFGTFSLINNISGDSNSAFGQNSLGLTTGSQNVAMGYESGLNLTSGINNIIIGYAAQPSSATTSNQITLGNSSITNFRIPGLAVNWTTSAYGRATYASTSAPSGGADGDVWLVYTA